jgi:hypothetical protein
VLVLFREFNYSYFSFDLWGNCHTRFYRISLDLNILWAIGLIVTIRVQDYQMAFIVIRLKFGPHSGFVDDRKFGLSISIFNNCVFLYFSLICVLSAPVLPTKILCRILTPFAYVSSLSGGLTLRMLTFRTFV